MAKFSGNARRFDPYKAFKFVVQATALGVVSALVVTRVMKKKPKSED